jgi:uncharacterized protein
MLVQFTVANFLSFKEETTFNLLAENSEQHLSHVITDKLGKGRSLLRMAAIYGANGSGKSNLIKAIRFAQHLILEGTRGQQSIGVTPFKLGNTSGIPSSFEFIFMTDDILYSYGFRLNPTQILEEWLHATPRTREVQYFERLTSKESKKETKVVFGSSFKGKSKHDALFLDFVAKGTRPNQLFLTEAAERNVKLVLPIMEWFKDLLIISAESQFQHLEITVQNNTEFTDFLGEFLKASGTGIDKVVTEEMELDAEHHLADLTQEERSDFIEQLQESNASQVIMMGSGGERFTLTKKDGGSLNFIQLKSQHRGENGQLIDFTLKEESDGTQRLIHLAPVLFKFKKEREGVVIIDELDRRLHPLLSRFFIQVALAYGAANHNQLIFTTHDTNLLDLDFLRRDEIWFIEKDAQGSSKLESLAEFKIRPDLIIEKGYLNGRFGAIPFLGNLENLGWVVPNPQTISETSHV